MRELTSRPGGSERAEHRRWRPGRPAWAAWQRESQHAPNHPKGL